MLKKGEKVVCYNYHYGELPRSLNDNINNTFVIGNEYKVVNVYKDGYNINGTFFYSSDKMNMFYWSNFFWSKKDILNKKLKKIKNV